ncbi:MAG: dihydrofolate reductase family protein [Hyphomicrobiales bacterium]|nr:dihydrofolate reductase family protein [Hyphomicrobiales bacterium]MBV8826843.1 dihydrofolate reductase family protein [Hyphomicrobiales bacterium]MBV9428032.1 dihydrofolate reductase family protein [Bradyrhizobiaceae bacterium]
MNAHSLAAGAGSDAWAGVPAAFREGGPLPAPWHEFFGPLRTGLRDELMVVGQLGQSLDGRIATNTGHSQYINCAAGLDHLHRLRALMDAVVIGIGTVLADNPQLTVRRVAGPNPARVILDPHGRLPPDARVLTADGARRVVVTTPEAACAVADQIEVVRLAADKGHIAPATVLAALAARGLHRILIEGGARTVSGFMSAGCLDRLHVMVAPIILGTGRAGISLAPIDRVDHALRPPTRAYPIGEDVLFDCDLSAARVPIGRAKIST